MPEQGTMAVRVEHYSTLHPNTTVKYSSDVPNLVLSAGSPIRDGWQLRLPLLYDLEPDSGAVYACALRRQLHGFGADAGSALQSLLGAALDILVTLEGVPDEQLDDSARELRQSLRRQLHKPA